MNGNKAIFAMMYSITTSFDKEKRKPSKSLSKEQITEAEKLINLATELQTRYELIERTAFLFEEMISNDSLVNAMSNTYEAHAFNVLRIQLFRSLISDINAALLDEDTRTASVRRFLAELRRDKKQSLKALKAYHSDTDCLNVQIKCEKGTLPEEQSKNLIEEEKRKYKNDRIFQINELWCKINTGSHILENNKAKSIRAVRLRLVSHFERDANGLLQYSKVLKDIDNFSFMTPIEYIYEVKSYVYDMFLLITGASWSSNIDDTSKFYSKAFWDRLKNGQTILDPKDFYNKFTIILTVHFIVNIL